MLTVPPRTVIVYDSGFAPAPPFTASRRSPAFTSFFAPAYVSPSSEAISRPSSASLASAITTRSPRAGRQPGPWAAVWERTAGMVRGACESGYDRVGLGVGLAPRPALAVPSEVPLEELVCSCADPPPSPPEAHSPRPTPAPTVTATAAPTTIPVFTFLAGCRRLC